MTQPLRSIYERMTNPSADDLRVGERVKNLTYVDVDRMVDHIGQVFKHLASQRGGLRVGVSRDDTGWSIRIDKVIGSGHVMPPAKSSKKAPKKRRA